MLKQLTTFLENIRASGLLRSEQIEQISSWIAAANPDPQVIAKKIVQNGWLTAFQVKMLWKGRGPELMLNQYVLLDRLGEGGMGEVYRAKHRRMDRVVALKVIRKQRLNNPDAVRRFGREIQAAAQLTHENIVMAYDADQAGDRIFFAMEYVEGTNLSKMIKDKGPLSIAQASDCIRQAAIGLQHAYERGMVHRDIKPSNLLLNKNGVLKILDMGLARLQDPPDGEEESRITQEGLVVGTPDFLAPEQARNARTADIRADIYALGCTFYFLLCGQSPYPEGTPTEKMLRHTTDPIPPITRPDVPRALVTIIHKMMAKRPEDRFQTPAVVAYALQPFATGAAVSESQGGPPLPSVEPLALTTEETAYSTAGPTASAPIKVEDPPTEVRFRLPAPTPRTKPVQRKNKWNLPIAVGLGVLVIGLLAGGVYLLVNQSEPAGPQLDKEFKNNFDISFVLIPAGSFNMGSPSGEPGHGSDEGPVHTVKITQPFYMSITEITLRQYRSVVGNKLPRAYKDEPADLDVPITNVSMREIRSFLDRLNADAGSRKPGWEYRLPTEAEWEYASRAGTSTRFNTGDSLAKEQANFGETSAKGPGKVSQYPANAWGLFDMHGNVAEWVGDSYDETFYEGSPTDDPKGPERRRSVYVVRGGSYLEPADGCRSARRKAMKEELASADVGFRIVYAQTKKP